MPWCSTCDRFLSPPSVVADGTCPTCGRAVDPGRAHVATDPSTPASDPAGAGEEESPPIPWHLKALAAAVALYLGFRAWQGIEWLLHQLSS